MTMPSQVETRKPEAMATPVKKSVNRKPKKNGALRVAMLHLFGVSLFSEVEVRRNGVLEEMYDKNPTQNVD